MSFYQRPVVPLGELCERITKGSSPKWQGFKYVDEPGILFVTSENVGENEMLFRKAKYVEEAFNEKDTRSILKHGDVLTNLVGASIGRTAIFDRDDIANINQAVGILRCVPDRLYNRFLAFLLNSPVFKSILHANEVNNARANLSLTFFKNLEIPLPELAEQKQIVAILDEAFAAIAKAKENAEKNLANARELFESYLNRVFAQQGDGWEDKKLLDVCHKVTVGHVGSMKNRYVSGGVPMLRSQNIRPFYVTLENVVYIDDDFHAELKKSSLEPGDLAIVRTGYPGTAAVVPNSLPKSNCSDLVIVKSDPHRANAHFLALFFNSEFGKRLVAGNLTGAAQKHFNVTAAKKVLIPFPPVEQQQTFVDECLAFRRHAERLEAAYTQKLANLDELKQSLLQKAFTGQLTTAAQTVVTVPSLPVFPIPVDGISTTDLHAGILGLAYQQHQAPKTSHFGRVKGEKIAHLIENHIGIDLERSPVKDAAGPNDFGRIQTVESRAKKAGFFDVEKQADRYALKPKSNFDSLIVKTERCLADQLPGVMTIIELMAKMSTRQAEILATAFAAWNNLLIEDKDCSDESIVYEARENWHPKKLKIEPEKFIKAIRWMRDKEIVPAGRGKIVTAKSA